MAATDTPYRKQRALDIVFGVSCVLMLLTTVWMFAQDYFREWKSSQRVFRDVEEAVAERAMLARLPNKEQLDAATQKVATAKKRVQEEKDKITKETADLETKKAKADADFAMIKADLDSQASLYDILVEKMGEADDSARPSLASSVESKRKVVDDLRKKQTEALLKAEDLDTQLRRLRAGVAAAQRELAQAEDDLKRIAGDFDRFAKNTAQKAWKLGDFVRRLPVIDAFESPLKVQQVVLEDLPIDYAFKRVPRYDRCTTCHLGIDRASFDRDTLRDLANVPDGMADRLKNARKVFEEREDKGEKLAFDPDDLPSSPKAIKLTDSQIKEYAAHPRLDLFVDSNSPHPAEKFGCTICHSGQGSATDFFYASHTPTDYKQMKEWEDKHHWHSHHYWDFPMLPARFAESSCLQCHHQVLDLAPASAKSEIRPGEPYIRPGTGAKVVRGYQLIRENGCFGCHEIAGLKSGKEVGPDLRLEPNPPLEDLSASERHEVLADVANPPGTLRKVGPSLYRLSEKTNQKWTQKWLASPRGFRPSTKMPHFYGLSNNNEEVLKGTGQEKFPDAEMASIAYYLIRESQDYLQNKDTYRLANEARLKELQAKEKDNQLTDQDKKDIILVARRLELARTKEPVPISRQITTADGRIVLPPPVPTDAKARQAQIDNGRFLFTVKGCLACHSHEGTAKAEGGVPPVQGEATFGPDLTRLAAKIAPEGGDAEAKRRWLIQWILNPNLHHPRTRMPVVNLRQPKLDDKRIPVLDQQGSIVEVLEEQQAADIAAWLLSQDAAWEAPKVEQSTTETLLDLATVYLTKAAGMTRADVRGILGECKGLSEEHAKSLPQDADERRLTAPLDDDKLKWYIGKKSINRLGCFGCHNVPGFENSKPIGTPLNDWGKKDAERLAFEDIGAFVKDKAEKKEYVLVDQMRDDKGHGPKVEADQEAYEKYFAEALEHHQRDGFLHQKLAEPRSYDYNRIRTWDDRLRMPQFRFARGVTKPLEGETVEQAEARDEAEAREAVMTFVLGLVAEPIPAKYLHRPGPDKQAEVKGLHVLEKFNCAGCHQLRAGTYEFKFTPTGPTAELLQVQYDATIKARINSDNVFPEHNAWTGPPQKRADRLTVHGVPSVKREADAIVVKPTEAFRFSTPQGSYSVPAGEDVAFPSAALAARAESWGGSFVETVLPYLTNAGLPPMIKAQLPEIVSDTPATNRAALPPPLLRLGEKVQPEWLYQFLRNPDRVRPSAVLRMPRFNLSDEEAMALVNYFAAVDRLKNPGIGLTSPYLAIPQQEDEFWRQQTRIYREKELRDQRKLEQRKAALQPAWDRFARERLTEAERRLATAEADLKAAKDAETKAKPDEKTKAQEAVKRAEDARNVVKTMLDKVQEEVAKKELQAALARQWEEQGVYLTDAYQVLISTGKTPCLDCHQVPSVMRQPAKYPSLSLSASRLRPDWLQRWIASPQRLLVYPEGPHPMPDNFKPTETWWKDDFEGDPRQAATALRDVLMIYPKAVEMPANR